MNIQTSKKDLCLTNHKYILQKMFYEILEKGNISDEIVDSYISSDYIQEVNGICLDCKSFKIHLKKQRDTVESIRISFKKIIEELDTVFSNHIVEVHKKDGTQLRFQVIAEFTFVDNKIIACDELTHLLEGEVEDEDLGLRY